MKTIFILNILFFYSLVLPAQNFAPAAGEPGSTAIYKDSLVIVSWASQCIVNRGFINIADTNVTDEGDNKASYGIAENATGKADNMVVSLGDKGVATLYFIEAIKNKQGYDFAVFENGFSDTFLELAFVEVSSNGERFVRFPGYSNTQTQIQIGSFGELDATFIHNLAGKYRANYGTPFDLDDIVDSSGIDLFNIHYVRIIDVAGTLTDSLASFDVLGNKINDPWPTPYYNGGFDLDAVGVIDSGTGVINVQNDVDVTIYPNPTNGKVYFNSGNLRKVTLFNAKGIILKNLDFPFSNLIFDLTDYSTGVYFIRILSGNKSEIYTIMKIDK